MECYYMNKKGIPNPIFFKKRYLLTILLRKRKKINAKKDFVKNMKNTNAKINLVELF